MSSESGNTIALKLRPYGTVWAAAKGPDHYRADVQAAFRRALRVRTELDPHAFRAELERRGLPMATILRLRENVELVDEIILAPEDFGP